MKIVIKIVNSIKGKALQTRILRKIWEDMGALFENLLYHTKVRWLSRGNVLKSVFQLRAELLVYLKDKKFPYMIFKPLNALNTNLQRRDINIITARDKIKGLIRKIDLWSNSLGKKQLDSFQCIQEIMEDVSNYSAINYEPVFVGMQVALFNLKQQLYPFLQNFPEKIQNATMIPFNMLKYQT